MFSVPPQTTISGVAGEDGAASLNDGLHTGAADHTDGIGGDGIGETGAHADLTGDVLTETGGQDAAEHQLIDILGSDIRALEGSFTTMEPS